MRTKKILLALATTSVLAFGLVAPVYAEDPAPPPADTGATTAPAPDPNAPTPAPDTGAQPDAGTATGDQPK
jgi:hypothetical protein